MPRVLTLLTVAFLLVAAPARAQQTLAPPGNAGAEQYLETVPGASGNQTVKPDGSKPNGSVLPSRVRKQLESRGPDGKQLEALVDATAAEQPSSGAPQAGAPQAGERGPSAIDSVKRSLTEGGDSDGMGLLLPGLLVASTLLLGAAALQRHRRRAE